MNLSSHCLLPGGVQFRRVQGLCKEQPPDNQHGHREQENKTDCSLTDSVR